VKSKEDEFFDPIGIIFDIEKADRQKKLLLVSIKWNPLKSLSFPQQHFSKFVKVEDIWKQIKIMHET